MSFGAYFNALVEPLRQRVIETILAYRVRARHPTLNCHHTVIWDYGYHDLDAIEIGRNVKIYSRADILVYKHSPYSKVPGRLVLGDGATLGAGVHIRAAGGTIRIGAGSGIAHYNVLIAANHKLDPGEPRFHRHWDEERCGIDIGENVWTGANCVILPGAVIGDNAMIAAGSVVRGTVPAGELWGGVPARKIRTIE